MDFYKTKNKVILFILKTVVYSLAATCRYRFSGEKDLLFHPGKNKLLLAFWHRYILPLTFVYRFKNAFVLISKSKDGQIISDIIESIGYQTVRGSSRRGAIAALKSLRDLAMNHDDAIIVTPDGPKGPPLKVQPGVIYIAIKSKRPLLAVKVAVNRKIELSSWDRFVVPLPFSTISVHVSKPYYPDPKLDLERNSLNFEKIMLMGPSS